MKLLTKLIPIFSGLALTGITLNIEFGKIGTSRSLSRLIRGSVLLMLFFAFGTWNCFAQQNIDLYAQLVGKMKFDTASNLLSFDLYIQSGTNNSLANSFIVSYYISSDTLKDAGDTKVSEIEITPSMMDLGGGYYPTSLTVLMTVPGDWYILIVVDENSSIKESNENNNLLHTPKITVGKGNGTQGIKDETLSNFTLEQNAPNPFSEKTTFRFLIRERGFTSLKIYDMSGKEISTVVNQELGAGTYLYEFNPDKIGTGIYYYTLTSANNIQTKKLVLTNNALP